MNGWYVLIAVCLWWCWLAYRDALFYINGYFYRALAFILSGSLVVASIYFIIHPIKLGTYTKNHLDNWNDGLKQIYREYKCENIFFVEDPCEILYQKTTYYMLKETESQVNLDVRSK